MTTATKQTPYLHCENGDLTMQDVTDILNDSYGIPESLEGLDLEIRMAAQRYAWRFFDGFTGETINNDVAEERNRLIDRLEGFGAGYHVAKTGKAE